MVTITFSMEQTIKSFDLKEISCTDHLQKVVTFCEIDKLMVNINRKKYENNQEILNYLNKIRVPNLLDKERISLLSLLDHFQKKYVYKPFPIDFTKYSKKSQSKLPYPSIQIVSKMNNFAHLIGISAARDEFGQIICRSKPREFLDGVLYQWILLNSHDGFQIDYEKLEVFPWMHPTLTNPTYILPRSAINEDTKFDADLIFIRKILYSDNYAFHIVGLKQEKDNTYAFKSQFGITKDRYYRLKKLFDTNKSIFDFYKERR